MPRTLSDRATVAIHAQTTGELFIILLTLEHEDIVSPIRMCSDSVDMQSRGNTYVAYPFQLELPHDSEDRPPRARLVVDNVSREITAFIRSLSSAPTVKMEVVLRDTPDTVEVSLPDFELRSVTWDRFTVEGDLTIRPLTREPYPAVRFDPSRFPGVFG